VLAGNVAKMVRRHPHVFGERQADSPEAVRVQWQEIKVQEQAEAADASALAGIPAGMPALLRAWRVSQRAVAMGFGWEDLAGVMAQAEDEWREFQDELSHSGSAGENRRRVALEFGDLLFTLVNVARLARIHPETSLTAAIQKFEQRFRHMETAATAAGERLDRMPREALEHLWQEAKRALGD
jgi:tetrapyrrole methylase family protein/MazG family protein